MGETVFAYVVHQPLFSLRAADVKCPLRVAQSEPATAYKTPPWTLDAILDNFYIPCHIQIITQKICFQIKFGSSTFKLKHPQAAVGVNKV